ncbi:MAG: fasciclin domain-containing protein [Rhizobiales bacterium]|nr:fasciclin domain-containing protein [Hyphomicrobiales bacterium]
MKIIANAVRAAAIAAVALTGTMAATSPVLAKTVMVGGAPMSSSKTIVQNAVNAKNLTTLVAAVKAAGLVETLSGPGPFTVFAPTNAAFAKLPKGTVDTLLKPENKKTLTAILTYHVIPGKLSAADIVASAKKHGGRAEYKTVNGETLAFVVKGKSLTIVDGKGGTAKVQVPNVYQSNGVVHVINNVLLPK